MQPYRFRILSTLFFFFGALRAFAIIGTSYQLQLGNPSNATADTNNHSHYLIQRTVEAIDYNDSLGEPNWASWDLTAADVGSSGRSSSFFTDTNLPSNFTKVTSSDYTGSGYDRGHMCPSADRTDNTTDNDLVFFMSNIIPQAPTNNQVVWGNFEGYCRTLTNSYEILIICGPSGFDGTRIPSGKAAVPQYTWKIAVPVPLGAGLATNRIDTSTRVIAIKVPNNNYVSSDWTVYVTNVNQLQTDTGYTFFTTLPSSVANVLRAKVDGAVAPTITSFSPTTGGAGTSVTITGTGFTSASSVMFNGSNATFTVNSSTQITATVPSGATTGTISVIAPGGLATSASSFSIGNAVGITSQPSSQTNNAGATITFGVQASGGGTIGYQWRRGTTNLVNAGSYSGALTATLTVSGIAQTNAGSYTVVITNSFSSVTSSVATLTVIDPAAITSQPSSATKISGTTATFTVSASGTSPTFQWRKNGANLSDGGNVLGTKTSALTLTGVSQTDAASYSVVVTNAAASVTSSVVTLTVLDPPSITSQPQARTSDPGTTATFSVTATGTSPLSYQWRKNGVNVANGGNISGATTATLSIVSVAQSDSASYSVVVTNAAGSATSSSAKLDLTGIVSITTQPSSQIVNLGSDATFTVVAGGSGPFTYQWSFNGTNISGGTQSSYTIADATANDAGSYAVVVQNSVSSTTSSSATLTVATPQQAVISQWNLNSITVTNNPVPSSGSGTAALYGGTSATFASGSSTDTNTTNNAWNTSTYPSQSTGNKTRGVQFNVSTVGYENVIVTWDQRVSGTGSKYCRFQYTTNGTDFIDSAVISMATTNTFLSQTNDLSNAPNVRNNANFAFRIVAEFESTAIGTGNANYVTASSSSYSTLGTIRFDMVTVLGDSLTYAPIILTQPQDQTNNAGTTANFSVVNTGTAPFTYQWQRNGTALTAGGNISGVTNATLTLANVSQANVGSYAVVITNAIGVVTSQSATLTVIDPPTITVQPVNLTNVAGTTATFNVTAAGTTLHYQWKKNGDNLSDGGNISGATTAALSLGNVSQSDALGNSFWVEIYNDAGDITSSRITLTVLDPPQITSQPISQTNVAGTTAGFSVGASGTMPLGYQWRKNASPLAGATSSSISLASVSQSQAGTYDVVITNVAGSVTSAGAVLVVLDPPSISLQPQSQTKLAGASGSFTVSSSGSAPLLYQWQLNGGDLSNGGDVTGANSSTLSLNNLSSAAAGTYTVVVQNAAGSTTSLGATLTVNTPPTILGDLQDSSIHVGSDATLVVQVSGTAPLTYNWSYNGSPLTTTSVGQFTLATVATNQQGSYSVIVTNAFGSATSRVATLTVLRYDQTISWDTIATKQYGDDPFDLSADASSELPVQFTVIGASLSGSTITLTNSGSILVRATQAGNETFNPAPAVEQTVTITKAPLSVQADNAARLVGESNPTFTGTIFGLVAGDNIQAGYGCLADASSPVGQYSIVPTLIDPGQRSTNYDVTLVNGTLSITDSAPAIVVGPQNQTVNVGQDAQFTVSAGGSGISYQWRKGGVNLGNGGTISGTTTATLQIHSTTTSDAGSYSVVLSNTYGTVTSADAILTVLEVPSITSEPVSQTNYVGQAATLNVTAVGATPLTYQWRKNGSNISGATASALSFASVQGSDAASYSVVVTNQFGSVTSQTATMTVLTTNLPGLFNTGVDDTGAALGAGAVDHHYAIISPTTSATPFVGRDSLWLATNSVSAWITPLLYSGLPAVAGAQTNLYRITFDLSNLNPSSVRLNGNWSSDNDGLDILINGVSTGQSRAGNAPDVFTPFTITNGFVAGLNTVDFKVKNVLIGTTRTTTGLRVEFAPLAAFGGAAPSIVVQPKVYSSGGFTGLLQVVAQGSMPLRYQWRTNGVALPNATNASVSITPVLAASVYDVVITNSFGSVTSAPATLVTKAADIYKPTVIILLPKVSERLTNVLSTVLSGTATDVGVGVARVLYRLNGSEFEPAVGTTNWQAEIALVPGTNKVDVKALDYDGNESLLISRTFFSVIRSQFSLATNGLGTILSTASVLGTPTNRAMLEVGRPYMLSATPGLYQILSNWVGTVSYTNASRITFIMQSNMTLTANFIPNPFIPAAGSYNGLFYETNESVGVTHQSSGFITMTVAANFAFSGRLILDGDVVAFSGKFNVNGTATKTLSRARFGKADVTLLLALDFSAGDIVTGRVACGGNWTAELKADRAVFNTVNLATNYAGKYTMVVPHAQDGTSPGGNGWGTVLLIAPYGRITFSGALGDGTIVSQIVPISKNGQWPLYVQSYPVRYTATNPTNDLLHYSNVGYTGSLLGWLNFNDSSPTGMVSWIKTGWTNVYYTNGFTNELPVLGSPFTTPLTGQRALAMTNGTLTLSNGNLTASLTRNATLNINNTFLVTPTNQFVTMAMSTANGLLTGSFRHPDNTNKVTLIKGVIMQRQKFGAGNFPGTNETGAMLVKPN